MQIAIETSLPTFKNFSIVSPSIPAPSMAAPVVAPITANDPVVAHTPVTASATFTDADAGDSHTAQWNWGDGTAAEADSFSAPDTVTNTHTYYTPGIYPVTLTVTDKSGKTGQGSREIVVYDPIAGYMTGNGEFTSPAGAYKASPLHSGKAEFKFFSLYRKNEPLSACKNELEFELAGQKFTSESFEWMVIAGARDQFKGTGKLNNSGICQFVVTAIKGSTIGPADRYRIKIWQVNPATNGKGVCTTTSSTHRRSTPTTRERLNRRDGQA